MYTKPFKQGDLGILSFGAPESALTRIKTALDAGKTVEWKYSSFSDPGGDYCAVTIDGVETFRAEGY